MDKGQKIKILKKVGHLYELYHQGAIPTLTQHEVNPNLDKSSRLHYIYFTLYEKLQKDLRKHSLSIQINKHTEIWLRISTTLNKYFNNDPREIIKEGDNDVEKIIEILQKTRKNDFPYLGGLKLSNYWLYILDRCTDVKLIHKDKISIIPDTHIVQSSIQLGLVSKDAKVSEVENAWFSLLKESKLSPIDIHAVLWNWSRNNFKPTV